MRRGLENAILPYAWKWRARNIWRRAMMTVKAHTRTQTHTHTDTQRKIRHKSHPMQTRKWCMPLERYRESAFGVKRRFLWYELRGGS